MIMHNTEKLHSPPKYVKINTVHADAMISVMNEIKSGIHSTLKINNVDEEAVQIIIHNLPTKHSCGFDGINFFL